MKRRQQFMKKPKVRFIEAVSDGGMHLALQVLDSGGSEHATTARLTLPDGAHVDLHGKLSGIQFEQPLSVGAPTKTRRDVALLCAQEYFVSQGLGRSQAAEKVVDLWEEKRFVGITDSGNVRARVKKAKGRATALNSSAPFVIHDTANDQHTVCMIEFVRMLQVFEDDGLQMIFKGWVYVVGEETATYSDHVRITVDGDRDALRDDVSRIGRDLHSVIPWLAYKEGNKP
jgi:hypothetical protein